MKLANPAIPVGLSVAASRNGALDQRFALDVQSVDALRRTASFSPQEGLKQVSRQFEAIFMQMVLKSMRDATPSEGLFHSRQERLYTSMLDQQLAQHLSGRGVGLAEVMQAQLSRSLPLSPERQGDAIPDGALVAPQSSLHPEDPALTPANMPGLSFHDVPADRVARSVGAASQGHTDQFIARMMSPAQTASQASGVPAPLILAQAALESGWGRREIRAKDGTPSHNLFGIKAGKGWNGPVVETATTEYVDGVPRRTTAIFRVYASYDEAFVDYARFLRSNPRYAPVMAARGPAEAAYGLQRAGYATDPQYGDKLVRIMKQIAWIS